MPRSPPRDPPDSAAVARLVRTSLDTAVETVTRYDEGLNAVYRVDLSDDAVVCKTATFSTDEELQVEAALTDRLDRETDVPVATVREVTGQNAGPLDVTALLLDHVDGRTVPGPLSLSPADHERLVAESGRHLAAVHDADLVEGVGRLTVDGGSLCLESERQWPSFFESLVEETLAGLKGEGYTTGDGRFADLVPTVREALADGPGVEAPDPALLLTDYRPSNLVLGPPGATPLTEGVIDVGQGPVGDGLVDLALTEGALVDVPVGGTDRAERLRQALRERYRDRRSMDLSRVFAPGGRYERYRLYARARRLSTFDYWVQFARDEESAVARRFRSSVEGRADALR